MDRRLLVLAIGMFALGTDSYVVAGVLPEISRAFGVSVGAAGQMTTIYSVTFALLAPVIAALAASVPRKNMLLVGAAVFVLANLATAVAPTFGVALLTRRDHADRGRRETEAGTGHGLTTIARPHRPCGRAA